MKRTMIILSVLCAALMMTAAVWADDLFSGTENTIAITLSADDAEKLSDPETTDSFTGLFNINDAAFDGTIRRAAKDDMPEPGERPEGMPEPPADGERPEGMPEPPADGEKPEGEPPEGMPEMISYVITIDGTDYMIQGMPEMPEDGKGAPEKPSDAPDMPEQIGGTLSINGENKGNISIISLAK